MLLLQRQEQELRNMNLWMLTLPPVAVLDHRDVRSNRSITSLVSSWRTFSGASAGEEKRTVRVISLIQITIPIALCGSWIDVVSSVCLAEFLSCLQVTCYINMTEGTGLRGLTTGLATLHDNTITQWYFSFRNKFSFGYG